MATQRPSLREVSFHCALLYEDEARRDEFLADLVERASVEYRGRIPLRIGNPSQLRTYAKHARQEADMHLEKALSLKDA